MVDRDLHRAFGVHGVASQGRGVGGAPAVGLGQRQGIAGIAVDLQHIVEAGHSADVAVIDIEIEHVGGMQSQRVGLTIVYVQDLDPGDLAFGEKVQF